MSNIFDPSSNPINLANTNTVRKHISSVFNYLKTDIGKALYNASKLSKNNLLKYERFMEKKFPEFAENFNNIFMVVINQEKGIEVILSMLNRIDNVKKGISSFEDEDKNVTIELMSKYGVFDALNSSVKK